jgi:hypothetical protein
MKPTLQSLQKDIDAIKARNARVETDKAWETSLARKIVIALLTYIVIVIFFYAAELPKPFLNSIVPAAAFILSTFSFPLFKKWWIRKRNL